MIFIILLLIVCIIVYIVLIYLIRKKSIILNNINKDIQNNQIENDNIKKNIEIRTLQQHDIEKRVSWLHHEVDNLNKLSQDSQNTLQNHKQALLDAYENFIEVLNNNYDSQEEEYDNNIQILQQSYNKQQDILLHDLEYEKDELNKIRATRIAALEAYNKEQKIESEKEFYSISLDDIDLKEIRVIKDIFPLLRNTRALKMMIWTDYYSKKVNDLCLRVLGGKVVSGIYKITNIKTKQCYIGQAKDIKTRWREHIKCGLGIDTPANNKLYIAIQKDGIENFTFELLEECDANTLNEKEKSFIDIYDAYNYGYNSTHGNGQNKYTS